jgi:hypothetical protein
MHDITRELQYLVTHSLALYIIPATISNLCKCDPPTPGVRRKRRRDIFGTVTLELFV